MTLYKKILLAIFSVVLFVALFYGYVFYVWTIGIEEEHRGLKEGVARNAANDSPIDLPKNATGIYYAYELYWQGGCSIVSYRLPTGDLKKQAATHLRAAIPWVDLNATTRATVPEHRFQMHAWFQPSSIATGYESDSSGILWEPKVWIDDVNRLIYVIDQN